MDKKPISVIAKHNAQYLIQQERLRQDQKWGEQNHNPIEWMSILTEEVGEAAQGANEYNWGDQSIDAYKAEMVQVAAVAQAAVECLERVQLLTTPQEQ